MLNPTVGAFGRYVLSRMKPGAIGNMPPIDKLNPDTIYQDLRDNPALLQNAYLAGVSAFTDDRLEDAYKFFTAVQAVNPKFKNVGINLERVNAKLKFLNQGGNNL